MASEIVRNLTVEALTRPEESFMDKHIAKIAFAVASIALFFLSPLVSFLGSLAGFILHYSAEPNLLIGPEDKIITVTSSVFAIIGALASMIRLTPAGEAGGLIFQAIPFLCSMTIGSAGYAGFKWYSSSP